MQVKSINRKDTVFFSQQQVEMVYNQEKYAEYLNQPLSKNAFEAQIQQKQANYSAENRTVLVQTIQQQYAGLNLHEAASKNIEKLALKNTFTITTGHQLVAMTGPLYVIYKIGHVIQQCKELQQRYHDQNFVPIFWMATEDHDYEEIKSFHLFNRTISWNTDQSGPVGRFSLNNWNEVTSELTELFKNHPEAEIHQLLTQLTGENYAQSFRKLINELFGKYGVVIVDGDDSALKSLFAPYMQQEVEKQFAYPAITKTTEKLVQQGGKAQIIPREINLFYIENGLRERLDIVDDVFVIAGKGTFSRSEMIDMIAQNPRNFSPNVSLRPLYQEVILPNLCYVGGAGEINYWLQLKAAFDEVNVTYPLIQTRNSVIWVDKNSQEKMQKLGLSLMDFIPELHLIQKSYLAKNAKDEIDFQPIDNALEQLQNVILTTTSSVDSAMESFAKAENVRLEKQISQLKEKLYKVVKSKHDKDLKTIQQIKEKLFPGNGLQERYTNFLQLNPQGNYSEVIDNIVQNMQPFNGDLLLFEEN